MWMVYQLYLPNNLIIYQLHTQHKNDTVSRNRQMVGIEGPASNAVAGEPHVLCGFLQSL